MTIGQRWHKTTTHATHGKGYCKYCTRAAETAKTDAMMDRSDTATFTVTDDDGQLHEATVTRPTLAHTTNGRS